MSGQRLGMQRRLVSAGLCRRSRRGIPRARHPADDPDEPGAPKRVQSEAAPSSARTSIACGIDPDGPAEKWAVDKRGVPRIGFRVRCPLWQCRRRCGSRFAPCTLWELNAQDRQVLNPLQRSHAWIEDSVPDWIHQSYYWITCRKLLTHLGLLSAGIPGQSAAKERRSPSSTVAWLLVILLLPYIGVPLRTSSSAAGR